MTKLNEQKCKTLSDPPARFDLLISSVVEPVIIISSSVWTLTLRRNNHLPKGLKALEPGSHHPVPSVVAVKPASVEVPVDVVDVVALPAGPESREGLRRLQEGEGEVDHTAWIDILAVAADKVVVDRLQGEEGEEERPEKRAFVELFELVLVFRSTTSV
jgi:hypothetical protein